MKRSRVEVRALVNGGGSLQSDEQARFLANIKKADGCWEWQGCRDDRGYGVIGISRVTVRTHRLAYCLFVGAIGDSHVLHRCDNPPCVNPRHLFLGTHQDNMRDKEQKGRAKYGEQTRRLTEEDVLSIRSRHRSGERVSVIARSYPHLHHTTISSVVHRKTWKHLGENTMESRQENEHV